MLKLSNIHYWVLSFSHLHITQIHTERVDFSAQFRWLLTEKVDDGGVFWKFYRLMLNEEG